ncbi:S-adenosyl-L-methionine-dependent methyltransferase [Myxozyma melibiosi]|uniref:Leucine carboxyl methyltransferase 1 n=1 Tax=Myxozyma melibiosi TaxID=54550 RepID=A0ABR1F1Q0_9ASCO
MSRTKVVRDTDNDALVAKCAAANALYFTDPLLSLFLPPALADPPPRKLPLFNRGTYLRLSALSRLVDCFVRSGGRQIVSLGAGSDTRPFHILAADSTPSDFVYHELDFPASARNKAALVRAHSQLNSVLHQDSLVYNISPDPPKRQPGSLLPRPRPSTASSSADDRTPLRSKSYYIHGLDLRDLTSPSAILALPGLNPSLPTLIISECCLCYLEPSAADAILAAFLTTFSSSSSPSPTPLGIVSYEPFSRSDPFGKVMIHNLASRGISLPAMIAFPTLHAQLARLRSLGFRAARCADVKFIHDKWTSEEEMTRLDKLEVLDEREEFDLLVMHYGVYWASNLSSSSPSTPSSSPSTPPPSTPPPPPSDPSTSTSTSTSTFTGAFQGWNTFPHQS